MQNILFHMSVGRDCQCHIVDVILVYPTLNAIIIIEFFYSALEATSAESGIAGIPSTIT
jgi:hypothetical protein